MRYLIGALIYCGAFWSVLRLSATLNKVFALSPSITAFISLAIVCLFVVFGMWIFVLSVMKIVNRD